VLLFKEADINPVTYNPQMVFQITILYAQFLIFSKLAAVHLTLLLSLRLSFIVAWIGKQIEQDWWWNGWSFLSWNLVWNL